ncbi:hypothetical protein DFH09DRAFT_1195056, partial [Mycena vulgaris]
LHRPKSGILRCGAFPSPTPRLILLQLVVPSYSLYHPHRPSRLPHRPRSTRPTCADLHPRNTRFPACPVPASARGQPLPVAAAWHVAAAPLLRPPRRLPARGTISNNDPGAAASTSGAGSAPERGWGGGSDGGVGVVQGAAAGGGQRAAGSGQRAAGG